MYFITLSEMVGSKGEKIAKKVAEALKYPFYGEEELFHAAEGMGFLPDVKKLNEKGPAFFERFFSEKPKIYLDRLQSVIYELARKGDAVFFGRGSQLLLHSFGCAFHVLVTGSPGKRVQRVMDDKYVSREVAEKIVERSDQDKRGFFRFAFNEDWLNPHLYDLLLNTDKLSVESATQMIIEAAKSDEIKACGLDSVKSLGKLSLQRKVEAAFLEAGVSNLNLFITVEDMDTVRLYGVVHSDEEKKEIGNILRKMKEVKNVKDDLAVLRTAGGV
jgi:cytidylate kinase